MTRSSALQPRIERIVEALADERHRKHGDEDRDAGMADPYRATTHRGKVIDYGADDKLSCRRQFPLSKRQSAPAHRWHGRYDERVFSRILPE